MIKFDSKGSTYALDEAIDLARVRYAHERVDFHEFFPMMTTIEIRRILRGEQGSDTRQEIVGNLFYAQQTSPHDLWVLLLVQACEAKLVARRRSICPSPDPALDQLVFDTFAHALADIPHALADAEIERHVLHVAGQNLRKHVRKEHGTTRVTLERTARDATRARKKFRQTPVRLVGSGE